MTYKASNGLEIEVIVNRKNNKNIYFRVKEDLKLYVNAPMFLSSNSILKLIGENEKDILKMYEKMEDRCKDDDKFWYLGKKYYIEIKEDADEVTFDDKYVYTPSLKELDRFYQEKVVEIFTKEVEIAKKCFAHLPEFTLKFRKMRTRWGVCNTTKMTVTLNTELLKKDIELLDYVIVHELSHLIHFDHSKDFWNLVFKNYPNYKQVKKLLK